MGNSIKKAGLWLKNLLNGIQIPFLGVTLWQMLGLYWRGISSVKIGRKAAAISWPFFLSLFPMLLFLLSVLPYMPHYDRLQFYIFDVLIPNILPVTVQRDVIAYIKDFISPTAANTGGNFTLILTLFFASNGVFSFVDSFNEESKEKFSDVREYLISIGVTMGFIILLFLSIFGIYYSEVVLKLFTPTIQQSWLVQNLTRIITFLWFPLQYFFFLSLLYWIGTNEIKRFKQALPGALLTTLLFFLTTYFFAIFVQNFARYNVLYGSIGTVILIMVWLNVNVYLLLLGNILNLAIRRARIDKLFSDQIKIEELVRLSDTDNELFEK